MARIYFVLPPNVYSHLHNILDGGNNSDVIPALLAFFIKHPIFDQFIQSRYENRSEYF